MYNVVHYVDEIKLLSDQTPGVHGIISSYYPLKGSKEFSLVFTLDIFNKLESKKDGILFMLSNEEPKPTDIKEYKEKKSVSFKSVKKSGFIFYINGKDNSIKGRYNPKEGEDYK